MWDSRQNKLIVLKLNKDTLLGTRLWPPELKQMKFFTCNLQKSRAHGIFELLCSPQELPGDPIIKHTSTLLHLATMSP